MLAIVFVAPAAVVRRNVPLREVCSTERSGSTDIDMGSPISATPLASSTCWKSAGLTTCAAAGGAAVAETATTPATARRAAENTALSRFLMAGTTFGLVRASGVRSDPSEPEPRPRPGALPEVAGGHRLDSVVGKGCCYVPAWRPGRRQVWLSGLA